MSKSWLFRPLVHSSGALGRFIGSERKGEDELADHVVKRPHVLVISGSFPNPAKPHWGVFVAQILLRLKAYCQISVVCPIPWAPKCLPRSFFPEWSSLSKIPAKWQFQGMNVYFPRYFMVPKSKTSQKLQARQVGAAIRRLVRRCSELASVDLINAQYLYPEGGAAFACRCSPNVPVILSSLGSDLNVDATDPTKRKQIREAVMKASANIAVSSELAGKLLELGANPEDIFVIQNGIDKSIFFPRSLSGARKSLAIPEDENYVVFVGALREIKGLMTLVDSLKILKERGQLKFKTFLVGEGPLRQRIEDKIKMHGLGVDVTMVGMVPHDRVPYWISSANIFCLPSFNEGQPNVVLEALASGVPVVASSVGGIPALVKESSGILVPPGCADTLANALRDAFERKWDRAAIVESVAGLSWENTASRYFEVILRCLGSTGKRNGESSEVFGN